MVCNPTHRNTSFWSYTTIELVARWTVGTRPTRTRVFNAYRRRADALAGTDTVVVIPFPRDPTDLARGAVPYLPMHPRPERASAQSRRHVANGDIQ